MRQSLAAALCTLIVAASPPFLVGALAVEMAQDFSFGAGVVGAAIGACYLSAAVLCPIAGAVVDRFGASLSIRVVCLTSAFSLAMMACAPGAAWTATALALQGLPIALSQPAVNLTLASIASTTRRGLYFGLVQSSIPASILISGLILGGASTTVGWRPALGVTSLLALAAAIVVPRSSSSSSHQGGSDQLAPVNDSELPPDSSLAGEPSRWCLVALGAGGFLGSATATSLPAFAIYSAADIGLDARAVAVGVVVASTSCMMTRTLAAWQFGRLASPSGVGALATLIGGGAFGYIGLSLSGGAGFMAALVVSYALGWGWPGLFHLVVTRARPRAVGTVTGWMQSALFFGSTSGPIGFGMVAGRLGFPSAWRVAAVLAAIGSMSLLAAAWMWGRSVSAQGSTTASPRQ